MKMFRIKNDYRYVGIGEKKIAYRIQKRFLLFWWRDVKSLPIAFSEQTANELLTWYKSNK